MSKRTPKAAGPAAPARYRVLVGLAYATDPAIHERIAAGERIPMQERGPIRQVLPGAVVDDLPARSLPWLLARNYIEPVTATAEEVPSGD